MDPIIIKLKTIHKVKDFVKMTESFTCDIDAMQGRYIVNAKSVLALFSLNLLEPIEVMIHTDDVNVYYHLKYEADTWFGGE